MIMEASVILVENISSSQRSRVANILLIIGIGIDRKRGSTYQEPVYLNGFSMNRILRRWLVL
jgi:hypothetical protein